MYANGVAKRIKRTHANDAPEWNLNGTLNIQGVPPACRGTYKERFLDTTILFFLRAYLGKGYFDNNSLVNKSVLLKKLKNLLFILSFL